MTKTKPVVKIRIFGGFHNVHEPITILVSQRAVRALKDEGMGEMMNGGYISEYQNKKVYKHMCGMSDCQCGVLNWEYEIIDG